MTLYSPLSQKTYIIWKSSLKKKAELGLFIYMFLKRNHSRIEPPWAVRDHNAVTYCGELTKCSQVPSKDAKVWRNVAFSDGGEHFFLSFVSARILSCLSSILCVTESYLNAFTKLRIVCNVLYIHILV